MSPVISDRLPDQDVDQVTSPADSIRAGLDELQQRIEQLEMEKLSKELTAKGKAALKQMGISENFVRVLDVTNEERFNAQLDRLRSR